MSTTLVRKDTTVESVLKFKKHGSKASHLETEGSSSPT